MKRNKILASLLALSLCMGLTVPAFAVELGTDAGENTATITVDSELKIPTIKVTIGEPSNIIINPYAMTVKVDTAEVKDTLITSPALLTNESNVDMEISAVPTVTAPTGVTVQEDGGVIADGTAKKTISMKLYMAPNPVGETDAYALTGIEEGISSVPVKTSGSEAAKITLGAGAATATYGSYQIKGYSAGTDWADGDTIQTKIAFSIAPVMGTGTAD